MSFSVSSTNRNASKAIEILNEKIGEKANKEITSLEDVKANAIAILKTLKPEPIKRYYRTDELKSIKRKESYKMTFWEKIFKKNRVNREYNRKIKESIYYDKVLHGERIKEYISQVKVYNSYRKKIEAEYGITKTVDYYEICFFLSLYNLDTLTADIPNGFIRKNMLKVSDSLREKYKQVKAQKLDDDKNKHLFNDWTKIIDEIIDNHKTNINELELFDNSDIEYSLNILRNV